MNITITCRSYGATDSIKAYVEKSVRSHVGKYFQDDSEVKARVVLSKEAYLFTASISINDNHCEFIRVSSNADTAYGAIDSAVLHLSSKLRKYKQEKMQQYRKSSFKEQVKCKGYSFQDDDQSGKDDDQSGEKESSPIIIEEEVLLKKISVSEAAMEMELLSIPALLFVNSKTDRINMVYVRDDGNVIWIDPLNARS